MNNQNEFFNKNIVITGASSGIGLSAAFYFLNCNVNLIIKTDLEKKEQIEILLAFITKLFNSIDIFINCAGIILDSDIEKTNEEDFKYTINTNLRSVFIILKELRLYFSQDASIINLSY